MHLETLVADLHFFNLARLKADSIAVLEAAGIPAAAILAEHPGGSALRHRVINYLGHELDSLAGLAAQIVEYCIQTEYFLAKGADVRRVVSVAYRLGFLVALSRSYSAEDEQLGRAQREAADARRIYTEPDKKKWREMRAAKYTKHSARRAAELIARDLNLGDKAVETIRKELTK